MAEYSTLPPNIRSAYERDPRRRRIRALQSGAFNRGDITHPMQGLAQLLMAYKAGEAEDELGADYAKRGKDYSKAMADALGMIQPSTREVPATGHPGFDATPAMTENVPGDFSGAAGLLAGFDPALATQFAMTGQARTQAQRDLAAGRTYSEEQTRANREYDEAQAKIKRQRDLETFRKEKEIGEEFAPEKERRIIKGADGRNYYADTGKPVLKDVKTRQEKFLEMLEGPGDELGGGAGDDILGGADADIIGPPADISSDVADAGDETLIGGAKQPSVREIFRALPAEVQTGIKMAADPMKAFSNYMMRKKGLDITVDENGNIQISEGGSPYTYGKKGTGTLQEKLINTREGLARLQTIDESFRPEFLETGTRLNAAWSGIKESFGAELSPEDKAQLEDYSTFKMTAIENINRYIKEITGAQMSEAEAKRLRKGVPDPGDSWYNGDSPTEFQSKMNAQTRTLRSAGARYTYALKNGWDMSPENLEKALPVNKVEDLIEERGAALERQLRARRPDLTDAAIEGFVMQTLNGEFGMAE